MRSNRVLAAYAELGQLGLQAPWLPGSYVGRGFADLGHEEFYVMTGERLLSLATGAVTQVSEAEKRFFYWLPSEDDAIESMMGRGFEIASLCYVDSRMWELVLKSSDHESVGSPDLLSARSLELVLIAGLAFVLRG
jgi:hypothetical protein